MRLLLVLVCYGDITYDYLLFEAYDLRFMYLVTSDRSALVICEQDFSDLELLPQRQPMEVSIRRLDCEVSE